MALTDNEIQNSDRYQLLKHLAVSASAGSSLKSSAELALRQACELLGLAACAAHLWNAKGELSTNVSYAINEESRRLLDSLQAELFDSLRRNRKLVSAYLSFGGAQPYQTFTLPLKHGETVFGAVVGIQPGDKKLMHEDEFLEALSASIALHAIAEGLQGDVGLSREQINKERVSAIIETSVTVNHEINNPLTAILGNVQLLLLKRRDLDPELEAKLRTIEASAMKIRDVTQKLLRVTSARSVEYAEGTSMLDLNFDDSDNK